MRLGNSPHKWKPKAGVTSAQLGRKLLAWLYDVIMGRAERGALGRWRESVVAQSSGRVIEIGAGSGLNFAHYAAGVWLVATDPDAAMLARAAARARDAAAAIHIVAADAEALPFRDGAFGDGVVGLAMCTIPHPHRALGELVRAIAPGGHVRLLEHVRVDASVVGGFQDLLTPLWRRIAGGCRLNQRTQEIVAHNGFVIEAVRSHLGGIVVEIVARRASTPDLSPMSHLD